ncbi:MAG: hypothetical protein M3Z25_13570, partial [Actinomycetota bacterium]|nr:hypothetical protein [Actinomycetota bacterium]
MFTVETDGPAQQQVDALPAEALAAYAELRVVLETAPWSGRPYHRDNPHGALRTHTFGTHGQVVLKRPAVWSPRALMTPPVGIDLGREVGQIAVTGGGQVPRGRRVSGHLLEAGLHRGQPGFKVREVG